MSTTTANDAGMPALGILGAIDEEVALVREHLVDATEQRFGHITLVRGYLDVDADRRRPLVVVRCGVGKVNAALAAAAMADAGVTEAIFTGVAGALATDLSVGDLVVATDLVQHDVDLAALGCQPGELLGEPLSWSADEQLSISLLAAAAAASPRGGSMRQGRIVSGDQFITSPQVAEWLRSTFDAECVEMEGAAFAQACTDLGIRFAVVRSISDAADGHAHVDFSAFLSEASEVGYRLVSLLVRGSLG